MIITALFWITRIIAYIVAVPLLAVCLLTFFVGGWFAGGMYIFFLCILKQWHDGWREVRQARLAGLAYGGVRATTDWMLGAVAATNPMPSWEALPNPIQDVSVEPSRVRPLRVRRVVCPTCSAEHLPPIAHRCNHCSTILDTGHEKLFR